MLLVNTNPDLRKLAGGAWWNHVLSLDTAASDLAQIMRVLPKLGADKQKLYGDAFDTPPYAGPDYVRECDPMQQMQAVMPPLLMIVSGDRAPADLNSANALVAKASGFGTDARAPLVVELPHGALNANLGLKDTPVNAAYTEAVEAFFEM